MNHVFEFFINLKTKNKRHVKKFGITIWFVKKLELQNLSHIVCFPFLFLTLYKQEFGHQNAH